MSDTEQVLRGVIASDPYHAQFTPLLQALDEARAQLAAAEERANRWAEKATKYVSHLQAAERERDDAKINERLSKEQRGLLFAENARLLAAVEQLRTRAERAEADSKRLDWLGKQIDGVHVEAGLSVRRFATVFTSTSEFRAYNVRSAIDAAMEATPTPEARRDP